MIKISEKSSDSKQIDQGNDNWSIVDTKLMEKF